MVVDLCSRRGRQGASAMAALADPQGRGAPKGGGRGIPGMSTGCAHRAGAAGRRLGATEDGDTGHGTGLPDNVGLAPRRLRLQRCIAEVTNTPWGARVTFAFEPGEQRVPKALHVSPLMDMHSSW